MRYRALAARHYVGGIDTAAYFKGRTLKSIAAILVVMLAGIVGVGMMIATH